ncbi:SURF1 family protein [Fulvimarina sp. 2208YS6-2-32]|uniref:SURF1-like protein n=1 Tax=Fulvimarina uroteuthidis TaxID=3098149 RepID=A0ABU5HZP5_9HYPH|nr:SURF1 family protein [Fulvimarina sp. 2208YS6-2-32]MDY8108530.1 SURF1 family protein [Fulvimarina sp. 2208YS6-2-32]
MSDASGETASPAQRLEPMGRTKFALALGFCVVGMAILFALGSWQVERLTWKNALVERIDARIGADPIPLEAAIDAYEETGDVDYQPVTVEGRFLHGGERFFFTTADGQTGWNVYTPLLTPDDKLVIVNRGFVPYEARDPSARPGSQPDETVTIEGVARNAPAEKPGYFVPENEPGNDTFFWRDLNAMTSGLTVDPGVDLVPFFVDAKLDPASRTLPVGGQTIVSITNNHLQYAFTWFGIGAVLLVMTVMLVARQLRAKRETSRPS